jgi:DNA-binding NarL/FixJ family response regulator
MLRGHAESIKELFPDATVGVFAGAEGVLDFVREHGCDVLVSEIELSGVNGITLAKKIKKINPMVNIIFLTVCDEREHAREVLGIKPSGYIVKPAGKEQLELELKNLRYAPCVV